MNDFVKERNDAFVEFVKTGDRKKVLKYCNKYGVAIPKNSKVFAAGIYKAVQQVTDIPAEIKDMAFQKCVELGFSPLMGTYMQKGGEGGAE